MSRRGQRMPWKGQPATERNEAFVAYDDANPCVAAVMERSANPSFRTVAAPVPGRSLAVRFTRMSAFQGG